MDPKNKPSPDSQPLYLHSASSLEHTFSTQPEKSTTLPLCVLPACAGPDSRRWEPGAFSGLCWTCTLPVACAWLSRFPGMCGSFSKLLFLKTSHFPVFSPKLFSMSTVCPNWYPLPAPAGGSYVFNKSTIATSLLFRS